MDLPNESARSAWRLALPAQTAFRCRFLAFEVFFFGTATARFLTLTTFLFYTTKIFVAASVRLVAALPCP